MISGTILAIVSSVLETDFRCFWPSLKSHFLPFSCEFMIYFFHLILGGSIEEDVYFAPDPLQPWNSAK
jgi:hypothetical protein